MDEKIPAFIPPKTPRPENFCYLCKGLIGVFTWTDSKGRAHPWCASAEDWSYRPTSTGSPH
jgi:hypothetical protein